MCIRDRIHTATRPGGSSSDVGCRHGASNGAAGVRAVVEWLGLHLASQTGTRWSQPGAAAKSLDKFFGLITSIPIGARFEDPEGDGDVDMVFVLNDETSIELPAAG